MELSEGEARATRGSGVGRGLCFLGPMQDNAGSVYFEVEVLELEAQRSQTMALGFVTSLPAARPLLAERATDLGQGSFLVGYDLPKLYVNGETASKPCSREWRPLKELSCGDRVGILLRRAASGPEFVIYVNGIRKVSVPLPGSADGLANGDGSELWGVVDVHGAVRSVRLKRPPAGPLSMLRPQALTRPLSASSPPPTQGPVAPGTTAPRTTGTVRALERSETTQAGPPCKRLRLPTFPGCGCTVHLEKSSGSSVHVSSSDFCIGRDTKVVNLALESKEVPNMVSRTHARIVSNDGGVHVIDCRSLNGTWLNGTRVAHHLLRSGDELVIGNPSQGPAEFRFGVVLPTS